MDPIRGPNKTLFNFKVRSSKIELQMLIGGLFGCPLRCRALSRDSVKKGQLRLQNKTKERI
jgi:hypothetical protein